MVEMALKKLEQEFTESRGLSREGEAVKWKVKEKLEMFCRQSPEFAQAVVNATGGLKECIESTVEDCGNWIDDVEVYRRAAVFYFPTAKVGFNMWIDLGDGGFSNLEAAGAGAASSSNGGDVSGSGGDMVQPDCGSMAQSGDGGLVQGTDNGEPVMEGDIGRDHGSSVLQSNAKIWLSFDNLL